MSCTLLAADRSDGEENMSSDEAKSPVQSEQNTSCEKSGSFSFSEYTSDTPMADLSPSDLSDMDNDTDEYVPEPDTSDGESEYSCNDTELYEVKSKVSVGYNRSKKGRKRSTVLDPILCIKEVEDENSDVDNNQRSIESSDEDEQDVDENEIARDITKKTIYVKLVQKSEKTKLGKKKKSTRVYNAQHSCLYCHKLVTNWATHVLQHKDQPEVMKMNRISCSISHTLEDLHIQLRERKELLHCLRRKHDHLHNVKVIENEKGEIILGRRFHNNIFDLRDFGPCSHCSEWLKLVAY